MAKSLPGHGRFYDSVNPFSFDANGEYLYFLPTGTSRPRNGHLRDNHVILNPVQVMAVQLKAGQAPPFEKAATQGGAAAVQDRPGGPDNRVFPASREARQLLLPEGRQGPGDLGIDGLLRRERVRDGLHAVGEDSGAARLRHGVAAALTAEGTVSDWKLSLNASS